jgi:hypothetical protein
MPQPSRLNTRWSFHWKSKQFDLKPGQKVVFSPHKKTLRMVIVPPIEEAEGFLPGINTDIQRDEEDEVR